MENIKYFPGIQSFINSTLDETKPLSRQYVNIFDGIINLTEFALQIFSCCVIKIYENRISQESQQFEKKTKPIRNILRQRFAAPSLGTHVELARNCLYLIDDSAPIELIKMKEKLSEVITLGSVGILLNDLQRIFDKLNNNNEVENRPQIMNRENAKKPLLTNVLNEFIQFRNDSAHLTDIRNLIEDHESQLRLKIQTWREAFKILVVQLEPLLANIFCKKELGKIETSENEKKIIIHKQIFDNGEISSHEDKISFEEWYENQWDSTLEIIMHKENSIFPIDLFPFLTFNKENLYFYKRTKSNGYQYLSPSSDSTFTRPSKKKFNHAVFRTLSSESQQVLYWSESIPSFNSTKTIKANIPAQTAQTFIGRKKQIGKIREEIVEIPNQNGIVYGPGGVGKTALMNELISQLFQEQSTDSILYNNLIWTTAKSNFYNPIFGVIEEKPKQFNSLENILHAILKFFDYEDVEEYDLEELKELVLDLLKETKTLLIIDNFETIPKVESELIIKFFEINVKKYLRYFPNNFKLILTSRELIPSGFHQMKLEGLDLRESKLLMKDLFEPYSKNHTRLTDEQVEMIHKTSLGIPIVIKHCFGQLYEFNRPLLDVLQALYDKENQVIKFSYSEIFSLLKRNELNLNILILLEIFREPISIRQITEILESNQQIIIGLIPNLLNFQCIERLNIGVEEKYIIDAQIGLLSKSMLKENPEITSSIRKQITSNLTLERKMDYSSEEFEIIEVFKKYIEDGQLEMAESFLKSEISNKTNSHLLKLHFAIYLRDQRKEIIEAIKILEALNKEASTFGKHDPIILLALATCYTSLEFPDYDKANICYTELLKITSEEKIKFTIGDFFIHWSNVLKNKKEFDPIEAVKKRVRYKELSAKGLKLLYEIKSQKMNQKYQYLLALGHSNKGDFDLSLVHINQAINLATGDHEAIRAYNKFRSKLQELIKRNG